MLGALEEYMDYKSAIALVISEGTEGLGCDIRNRVFPTEAQTEKLFKALDMICQELKNEKVIMTV